MTRRPPAPLFALLLGLVTGPAAAGTEEFSTFDVILQEADDESLLDHLLTRTPRAWRDEWERSPQALRTSQGCLTSGQWLIGTELKLRAPLGERARFGLDVRDDQSDRVSLTYLDFSFRFPTGHGTPGFWFRPLYDKSRQDLGLFWEAGTETSEVRARATFTLEDVFNNLWEFRQSRVGDASEPYVKHPFEPAAWLLVRRPGWRLALEGQYLTPSRKRHGRDTLITHTTLWGALGRSSLEARLLGIDWSVAGEGRQARSVGPGTTPPLQVADFRRQWSVEIAAGRALGPRLEAEARWLYQSRDQDVTSADRLYLPLVFLDAIDRVVQLEARFVIAGGWSARAGGLYDRVTVAKSAAYFPTHGTRTESRAYVGLSARFGSVVMSAVEGIELDPEPYEVWWIHDKAFVHLQATF